MVSAEHRDIYSLQLQAQVTVLDLQRVVFFKPDNYKP